MTEQSIIGARASVMVYDDNQKKWVPSGTSSGLSKVQIYHHQQHNTFRVVGRKLQDHEVVINCSIIKGLKYNQATATFHQWRDSKYVYGLNFSSQHDAEAFARAMMHALEVLSGRVPSNPGLPTNGNGYEEDMGYRTMTSEDAAILRQQQSITGQVTPNAQTPTSQTNQNNIPQSPPTPQGHHRTSRNSLSAPPAPQPGQMSMPQQQQQAQHYGQPGSGPPTQNGLHQTQSHQQIPPAPGQTGAAAQYQQQQAVYAAQAAYGANQYQPTPQQQLPHYMLTNSNSNVSLQQYSQQQQQQQQLPGGGPPQPPVPPHQTQNGMLTGGSGAPIYVSTQAQLAQGIPTSASANSVVYASQQQVVPQPPQPPQPPMMQQQQQQQNGVAAGQQHYGQQNGGHNMLAGLQQQQQHQQESPYQTNAIGVGGGGGSGVPMPPPLNRMSSNVSQQGAAPAAPPPPPSFGGAPMYNGAGGGNANIPQPPQPPAAPPAPPMAGGAAPPPPPPPPMGGGGAQAKGDNPQADLMDSLATQLQQVKLKKKTSSANIENSGGSTTSGGSAASGGAGNYGTIGRGGGGMASMMDEMAKTLARRRAQAEKKEPDGDGDVKQRPWEKSNTLPHKLNSSSSNSNSNQNTNATTNSGNESPRPLRKRFGSASEETILQQVNGDSLSIALSGSDLETLKADILREMRQEMQKIKQDIIEVIKSEFNRR